MGEEIFRRSDMDGDSLEVYPGEAGSAYETGLIFRATTEELGVENFVSAGLTRDKVLSLIQALSEWAYPHHTPESPNRTLIEDLIAKAVEDQVAAVLPLHLSPVARCDGTACCAPHPIDPEPRDVGHPEHAAPIGCTARIQTGQRLSDVHSECGYVWAMHPADVPAPRQLVGCECGHSRRYHAVLNGGCTLCQCTRSRDVR